MKFATLFMPSGVYMSRSQFSKIMIPKEMKYNLSSLCSTFRSPLSDSLYTDEYIDREGVDQPAQIWHTCPFLVLISISMTLITRKGH